MEDQVFRSQFEVFACLCKVVEEIHDVDKQIEERVEEDNATVNI